VRREHLHNRVVSFARRRAEVFDETPAPGSLAAMEEKPQARSADQALGPINLAALGDSRSCRNV
jgi:hypothetical protein